MTMQRVVERRLVLAATLVVACGPRKPPLVAVFPREINVYVSVTDRVAKSEDGNVSSMVDAIESDLRDEGRVANIVPAHRGQRPPLPRLELQVMDSNSGDTGLHAAGYLLGGAVGAGLMLGSLGHMQVDVYLVAGDGSRPHYLGRFEGSSFGAMSEESIAAGQEVGHSIVESLYR
jgi:hypothetical protein